MCTQFLRVVEKVKLMQSFGENEQQPMVRFETTKYYVKTSLSILSQLGSC